LVTTGLNDLQINKEKKCTTNTCVAEERLPFNLKEECDIKIYEEDKVKKLTPLLFPFVKKIN